MYKLKDFIFNPVFPASRSFWWVHPSSERRTLCAPLTWPCSRATSVLRSPASMAGAATPSWTPMSAFVSVVFQGPSVRIVSISFFFNVHYFTSVWILLPVKELQWFVMRNHIYQCVSQWLMILSGFGSPYGGCVPLQWLLVSVETALFPYRTSFDFTLKGFGTWKHFGFFQSVVWVGLQSVMPYITQLILGLLQWKVNYSCNFFFCYLYFYCVQSRHGNYTDIRHLFYVGVIMYWFQTKEAVMKTMKCVTWIFMKCSFHELHIPFIILMSCQANIHSGLNCLTYSVSDFAVNLVRVANCPFHVN